MDTKPNVSTLPTGTTMLDLRHFWTDISAYVFGLKTARGELDHIASQTGHSTKTHNVHYITDRPLDELFQIFHRSLGETECNPP